jgi:hypothetical protein
MDDFFRDKPYWSERQLRGPLSGGVPLEIIKKQYLSVYQQLTQEDYFQEAIGYYCVDEGWVDGKLGSNHEGWFLRELGKDVWPPEATIDSWDEDTFFDVVEALHDLCSKGTGGRYHDFSDCGWHYNQFDREAGRADYRAAVNRLLKRYETPMELDDAGHLVELGPKELRPLFDAPLPEVEDSLGAVLKTQTAITLFRSRSSSADDRRIAVRELADVLESLRPTIKEAALPKDEQEFFKLANGFAIRHNNRVQRRMYDDKIWLSWAFYVYLATIHAILRLSERQSN